MNKLIGIVMVMYLLGDPDMSQLEWLGVAKEFVVTVVLTLVSAPWIGAQFDN